MNRNLRKSHVSLESLRHAGATIVSLAKNPRDLRPAIDAITNKVAALHQPTGNQPTIVLYGEEHSTSSHTLLPLFTMSALNKVYKGRLSSGIEMPYNYPAQIMADLGHNAQEIAIHLGHDPDGTKAVKILADKVRFVQHTPISNMSFLQFCLARSISTCFADLARDESDNYLDNDDPVTRDILMKMGIDISQKVSATSPAGVAARNFGMQINVQSHVAYSGKPICSLRCGAAHVFGDTRQYSYAGSLTYLFAQANVTCIPVISLSGTLKTCDIVAPEAVALFQNAVVITGMDERRFGPHDMKRETAYIEDAFAQSGFLSRVVQ